MVFLYFLVLSGTFLLLGRLGSHGLVLSGTFQVVGRLSSWCWYKCIQNIYFVWFSHISTLCNWISVLKFNRIPFPYGEVPIPEIQLITVCKKPKANPTTLHIYTVHNTHMSIWKLIQRPIFQSDNGPIVKMKMTSLSENRYCWITLSIWNHNTIQKWNSAWSKRSVFQNETIHQFQNECGIYLGDGTGFRL